MRRIRLARPTQEEQIQAALHFQPTVACINRLPDRLRRWVMKLETKCDHAGDFHRAVLAEDLCKLLVDMVLKLKQENQRLEDKLRKARG
jgi:hypothetical protein